MKIAFVNLALGDDPSGVAKAVKGQARAARLEGLPIDFLVVNPAREEVDGDLRYVRYPTSRLGARASNLLKARALARTPALSGYDVLLLRYPTALDLDPLALLRTTRARVIMVYHTKEVPELLSRKKTAGVLARAAFEWLGGRIIRDHVHGVVGVTDEIRRYEMDRGSRDVPSRTIANGVDVEAVAQTGFVPFDGKELKLLFVASSQAPWHGVDRLVSALRKYDGARRIVLELVGGGSGAPKGTEEHHGNVTIRHHGHLGGDALDHVFRGATIAVSSLAMYRAGLAQACVLKTREYVARGIPFVYAYDDVDLAATLPFARRMPNDATELPVDALFAFAEEVSRRPNLADEMRAYASANLDWRVKMRLFHDFARDVGGVSFRR